MMDSEEPITLSRGDFFRIIKTLVQQEKYIVDLQRQVFGLKKYSYDDVLKWVSNDFGVPREEIENIKSKRYFLDG